MGGRPVNQDAQPSSAGEDRELRQILRQLEATGDGGKWVNKRTRERQKVTLRCAVHHFDPVIRTVRAIAGQTRDLSLGGASVVTRTHFRRAEPVVIVLSLPAGGTKTLTGSVVYSRSIRMGWYLTGVRFEAVHDERLRAVLRANAAASATETPRRTATTPPAPTDGSTAPSSPRDQALQLLSEGSSGWRLSGEKIAKVLDCSRSADHVVRRATIPVLMQIGGMKAGEALRALLEDGNPEIQAEAADALGYLHIAEAKEQLAELLRSKTELVALSAAEALGRLGDQRGLRLVAQYVMSERALNRRAARALGIIVGQEFRPTSEGLAAARCYVKQKKIKV